MGRWFRTFVLLVAFASASCAGPEGDGSPDGASPRETGVPQASRSASAESTSPSPSPPPPAEVEANELGAVPVLMYHRIVPKPSSVYDRSPQDFRAELERLADEDYVPVTAAEYSTGDLDIPAGTHPVVLTFDDSTNSQLDFGPDGAPVPDCAVGILLDVADRHPQFRPVATFFVNTEPFSAAGGAKALAWLHQHGFEVGNHTANHGRLNGLGRSGVQREIATNQKAINAAVPDADVVSMGLPFGIQPEPAELALRGRYNGTEYRHHGAYLVGANPAPSPYTTSFAPEGIPRIRSAGPKAEDARFGSSRWLDQLADGTVPRYTSDGDPERISYPESASAAPAKKFRARAQAY